ncbi:hypothetical protein ACH5RR_001302 [Cinchona calisaya]|uniref:Retrovirus-related Pol polyprotein from transposon TNT 1-94-like beta-barrel domain-containing protein n=1 Tax=Cinchona calisaya TaxID=153742 RepID=A0ABD3B3L4_9GENT
MESAQMAFMAMGDNKKMNITKNAKWFVDSGCSRHMIGDASIFTKLKSKNSGKVIFGDNMKAKSIGIGDVGKNGETLIKNVFFVDNLNYNLLSVSQLCDKNLCVIYQT